MVESWSLPFRSSPREVLEALSPGQITGVYDDAHWVDWQDDCPPEMQLASASRIPRLRLLQKNRFLCLLDTGNLAARSPLPNDLPYLLNRTRGIALVSSRPGFLLRWSHRLLVPGNPPRERNSGPLRPRLSGPRMVSSAGTLRLLESSEIARSAMLALGVFDPHPLGRVLRDFPGLQFESGSVHLSLEGHSPEEILGLLRAEGIRVTASAVWYALLQSPPRLSPNPLRAETTTPRP